MDSQHRCFEKNIEDGQTRYYVSKTQTENTIVLHDGEEIPLGTLRAKPFSIKFIKKHMYSKVEIKPSLDKLKQNPILHAKI